jgi:hypothetical protein
MAIQIKTGDNNYEILDTGTVITFKDEPIKFQLAPDLKIIISFKFDKELKEQKMDFDAISNNELEIILTNFNSSLGTANLEPLPLAKINNRQVYLNFMIYALNESSHKTVHYTWYLREEVANVESN